MSSSFLNSILILITNFSVNDKENFGSVFYIYTLYLDSYLSGNLHINLFTLPFIFVCRRWKDVQAEKSMKRLYGPKFDSQEKMENIK